MAGPCKRSGSRYWWYRKGTPTDILNRKDELAGLGIKVPTQVWRSLKTENRKEAERTYAAVSAKFEQQWELWRRILDSDYVELRHKQITALAGAVGKAVLQANEDEPGEAPGPPQMVLDFFIRYASALYPPSEVYMGDPVRDFRAEISAVPPARLASYLAAEQAASTGWRQAWLEAVRIVLQDYYKALGSEGLDKALADYGIAVDADTRTRLEERTAHFVKKAYASLHAQLDDDEPDYREPEWVTKLPEFVRLPPTSAPKPSASRHSGKSFEDLLDRWKAVHERSNKAAATLKRYPPAWFSLKEFVKHDRPLDITIEDLRNWREWLLTVKDLKPTTVKKVHITAIKTIYNTAFDDGLLSASPAKELKPPSFKTIKTRENYFTASEAKAILTAATSVYAKPGRHAAFTLRALRWIPWICAYTGARVSEIAQLRKEDIESTEFGAFFLLTPEAGTIKTGVYRRVPVHEHLVEQGFLKAVEKLPNGPIFYNPKRTSSTPWAEAGSDVADFVREVAGVTDPSIQPNHAWRHLFKTMCRHVGIETYWHHAFTGHSHDTSGDEYGDGTDQALRREMDKFPRFEIEES